MNKRIKKMKIIKGVISLVFIIGLLVIAVCIASIVSNEHNKIDSGVVVDKDYWSKGNSCPSYALTIKGEKNGKTVEYRFHCSEKEYNSYNIGDKYPKGE